MPAVQVVAVVPAAGFSTRFGAAKLLTDVDGEPLIARTLASLLDAGIAHLVVVTREGSGLEDLPALNDRRVTVLVNPDPARGMFSSIQAGLAAADGDIVLVLPADMPFVSAETVAMVAARAVETRSLVIPLHQGRRGHPIAFPRALCDILLALEPTATLKDGLAQSADTAVCLDVTDPGVLRDVDVAADLSEDHRR